MFAKINHMAIVSSNHLAVGKFYEAIFGMKLAADRRGGFGAVTVRDGYVGLNVNSRKPGRPGGLDHFGVEVQDVETVFERMRAKYPQVRWLKRPSTRPYAGISTHDPDGNVFDLSQKDMANRGGLYVEEDSVQPRRIDHYAVRTMRPELCAEFYREVLDLTPTNRKQGDPNYYLTDGRVTLEIMPWDVQVFDKTGIARPGPDHLGFRVEDAAKVKQEIADLAQRAGQYGPWPLERDEDSVRGEILQRSCPLGTYQFCDNDGVMFDIAS